MRAFGEARDILEEATKDEDGLQAHPKKETTQKQKRKKKREQKPKRKLGS
jgi:hypothetical protein